MGTEYVWVNWKFNIAVWAAAVEHEASVHGADFVSEIMGVHPVTVKQWVRGGDTDFPYPHMTNFLKFVNTFDYDPRSFWTLEK